MKYINGTALELVHTNAEIINSLFLYNQHGSYRGPIGLLQFLILRQQISPQSLNALVGRALIVNSSNVSATGSRFEGNIVEIGGAFFSEGNSSITLTDCILINNHAFSSTNSGFGGAIVIFSENGPYSPILVLVHIMESNNNDTYEHKAYNKYSTYWGRSFSCILKSN